MSSPSWKIGALLWATILHFFHILGINVVLWCFQFAESTCTLPGLAAFLILFLGTKAASRTYRYHLTPTTPSIIFPVCPFISPSHCPSSFTSMAGVPTPENVLGGYLIAIILSVLFVFLATLVAQHRAERSFPRLYGISIAQAYVYWLNSDKDKFYLKAIVGIVMFVIPHSL